MNAALYSHTRHYSKAGVPPFQVEYLENYVSLMNSLITLVAIFFSPQRPDRAAAQLAFYPTGHWGLIPSGKVAGA
jgi:hypothetical protein